MTDNCDFNSNAEPWRGYILQTLDEFDCVVAENNHEGNRPIVIHIGLEH